MNYAKIDKVSVADGIGIRTVLYVSGCSLHCKGCHNPECWDHSFGKPFTEDTMQELLLDLKEDYIQGVTISGGHPLDSYNLPEVYEIVKRIKMVYPNKDIWCYTGFRLDAELKLSLENPKTKDFMINMLRLIDVLVDGPFIEKLKNPGLRFRGSSNQRIIDIQETFKQGKIILSKYN